MFKLIAIIVVVCCAVSVAVRAAPVNEGSDVKTGMSNAYRRGIMRFGQGDETEREPAAPVQKSEKPRTFSQYSARLQALGGGKPLLREQYRENHYNPLAPSVLPVQHPITPNGKLTAAAAAKIYVPHRPYQYSTDHMW